MAKSLTTDLARNVGQVSELVRPDNTSWGPRR
jgi:hypothetical protein